MKKASTQNCDASQKDFNSIFWKVIGVNNRVYQFVDIFPAIAKETPQVRYKNVRSKEADEKSYERFLSNELKDSSKNLDFKINEIFLFFTLLKTIVRTEVDYDFYSKQAFNLLLNYFSFSKSFSSTEKMMNLFAFQLAFIIEYMRHQKLNTELFELAIQKNSMEVFVDECKKRIKCKTDSSLAQTLSYKHDELKDILLKDNICIKSISTATFIKNISNWKNEKDLPTLIHIFSITKTLDQGNTRQTEAEFIQLLIVRIMLSIEEESKTSLKMKKKFIQKISTYKTKIYSLLKNDLDKVVDFQSQYLQDFSSVLEVDINILKGLSDIK